jgi:hypothetical protein
VPLTSVREADYTSMCTFILNESYQRGCQEKFSPSSPKGDECCGLHPAQSQFWRGCGRAAHSRQTKPVDGFYSTVS